MPSHFTAGSAGVKNNKIGSLSIDGANLTAGVMFCFSSMFNKAAHFTAGSAGGIKISSDLRNMCREGHNS